VAYLLDANVFIQAKNLYYGFDICPAFWDWLDEKSASGDVLSINEVRDELVAGEDELASWAQERGTEMFRRQDQLVAPSLARVAQWVQAHPDYAPAAKSNFLQVADFVLVAFAHAHGHEVVTQERHENSVKKVKIPSVCLALSVPYTSPFNMLKRERARFILGPSPGPRSSGI
jgi:hypothetical protein